MQTKVIGVIVAYFACLLGMALATGGEVIDDLAMPLHHHLGRGFNHPRAVSIDHGTQLQERKLAEPYFGPVHRCHDPHPEVFGPAPPVEDCKDVIKQFTALPTIIDVKLVEGCYQIVSGNCTGLVCPQRLGESTITGALAAKFMESPLLDECIAKGQRGWWIDGQGLGIGVYLT